MSSGLQEFQHRLTQRLQGAASASAASLRIALHAGPRRWLLKLEDAGEIQPLPELSGVPLARAWFLGLANIRGSLAGVVDFSAFMGGEPTSRTPECRLVLLAERFGAHCGLLVSRVSGLRNLGEFLALEEREECPWAGPRYRDGDGCLWSELNAGALVAHDDFLRVGL